MNMLTEVRRFITCAVVVLIVGLVTVNTHLYLVLSYGTTSAVMTNIIYLQTEVLIDSRWTDGVEC